MIRSNVTPSNTPIASPPPFAKVPPLPSVKNSMFSSIELPFSVISTLSISKPENPEMVPLPENREVTMPGLVTMPGKEKLIVRFGPVSVNESAFAFTAVTHTRQTTKQKATLPRVVIVFSTRAVAFTVMVRSRCWR